MVEPKADSPEKTNYDLTAAGGVPPLSSRVFAHCVRFGCFGGKSVSAISNLPDGIRQKVSRAAPPEPLRNYK